MRSAVSSRSGRSTPTTSVPAAGLPIPTMPRMREPTVRIVTASLPSIDSTSPGTSARISPAPTGAISATPVSCSTSTSVPATGVAATTFLTPRRIRASGSPAAKVEPTGRIK
jgi:hypothetical protein